MFKINIHLKFALIAIFLGGGIILAFTQGFWYAFIFLLIGIGLLASYFLLGTIQSAAEMVQTMDLEGAEKRLNLTYFPNLLLSANKPYYYIIRGTIAMQRNDITAAEGYLTEALELNPADSEKGMVLLQLANISAQKNKWTSAQNYYRDAKKLNITEPQLKAQVEEFGKALKNRGQAKSGQGMGRKGQQMTQGGKSKRRRPKMR
ncbi:MAG: tetratricopeptide (TPR) repeat protein [Saprospiraceae bacterium]|jgi:tetratricopeptide (TPR) repeat protein